MFYTNKFYIVYLNTFYLNSFFGLFISLLFLVFRFVTRLSPSKDAHLLCLVSNIVDWVFDCSWLKLQPWTILQILCLLMEIKKKCVKILSTWSGLDRRYRIWAICNALWYWKSRGVWALMFTSAPFFYRKFVKKREKVHNQLY